MKKTLAILLAALLAVSLLASCSAKMDSGSTSMYDRGEGGYVEMTGALAPSSAPAAAPPMYDGEYAVTESKAFDMDLNQTAAGTPELPKTAVNMSEKIIYTVSADIETVTFDDTINKVYAMLDGYGAFIENSYVGGKNYWQTANAYQTYRSAWFTLRVPVEAVTAMTDQLGGLGSVTGINRSAENVTSQFIDTEARLRSYRTQEERLFSMMEKAETVEDMLTIEGYMADVRYQIEAMTSQLTNWQQRVDYSTLTLNINEVEKLSELPPQLPLTYWQQIKNGFGSTLRGIGDFFKSLLKWLIVNLPVLVILAVIIIVIIVVIKRRRRAQRRSKPPVDTPPDDRSM